MENKLILATGILYNEQIYVDEWINFHLKQGFDLIYLYIWYMNDTDRKKQSIETLIEKYNNTFVKVIHIKFYPFGMFKEFIKNESPNHENDWLCVLDIDEFIYSPIKDKSVKDIVHEYKENNVNAVRVNWKCFGSSGLVSKPESVLQSFTKCSQSKHPINFETKSIQKINVIKSIGNSHCFILKPTIEYCTTNGHTQLNHNIQHTKIMHETRKNEVRNGNLLPTAANYLKNKFLHHVYPEDEPKLVINHYIIRSKGEYQIKINNNPSRRDRYNMQTFNRIDSVCNETNNFDIQTKI